MLMGDEKNRETFIQKTGKQQHLLKLSGRSVFMCVFARPMGVHTENKQSNFQTKTTKVFFVG